MSIEVPPTQQESPAAVHVPSEADGLAAQAQSGASWFFWIGGLSVINSILAVTKVDFSFSAGLGITAMISAFSSEVGGGAQTVGFVISIVMALVLLGLGVLASRLTRWAYIVGTILVALDTLLLGLIALKFGVGDLVVSIALHAWALFSFFSGFGALNRLEKLKEASAPPRIL